MIFKRADQSSIIDEILKESVARPLLDPGYKVEYSWPKVLKTFKEQVLKSITTKPDMNDEISQIIFQTDNIHPHHLDELLSEYTRKYYGPVTLFESPSMIKRNLKNIVEKAARGYQQDIKDYFSDKMNFPPGHPTINFVFNRKVASESIMELFSIIPIEE